MRARNYGQQYRKHDAKIPGKGRTGQKVSPSMAWSGFVGLNETSYGGIIRSEKMIFNEFIGEGFE